MRRYTESHEWVAVEGDEGVVGISHQAQEELGEIVYVELPEVGKQLQAGEEAAVVESTKAATDIYTPVSGRVTVVNEALRQTPTLINRSAEEQGWLYKLQLDSHDELEQLADQQEYAALFESDGENDC
jgi:glycine cleavage system H protein